MTKNASYPAQNSKIESQQTKSKKKFSKKELTEAVRRLTPGGGGLIINQKFGFDAATEGVVSRPGRARSCVLDVVEWGVNMNAKKFNELRTQADNKASLLKSRLETLRTLKIEQASLQKLSAHNSLEAKQTQKLLETIDFFQDDIDQSQHERRQLEHMLKRLENNQLNINQHVKNLDHSYNAAIREKKQMESMLRQIEAGYTKANFEYNQTERSANIEHNEKFKALQSREIEAKQAASMEEWRKRRELARKDFASELRGDLSKADEIRLQQALRAQKKILLELRAKHEFLQKEAAQLESTFLAIRQASGVHSLDEVVDKFQSQEGNRQSLMNEKKEAEERLTNAKNTKYQLDNKFAQLKASGIGSNEMNRDIAQQLETEITHCRLDLKTSNASCQRLESILVALRQGAIGLYQRLRPFVHLLEGEGTIPAAALPNFDHRQSAEPVCSIDSIDAIHVTEILLSKMVEIISGATTTNNDADQDETSQTIKDDSCTKNTFEHTQQEKEGEKQFQHTAISHDSEQNNDWRLPSPKNNIRVMSTTQRKSAETVQAGTIDESFLGPEIGQASQSEPSETTNELNSANALTDQAGNIEIIHNNAHEDVVPSRSFLKLSSSRQHHEMLRRIEHDSRKKRNIEMADLSQFDRRQISTRAARKKAQNEANDRLSTQPSCYQPPFSKSKESAVDRSLELLHQSPTLE